MNKVVIFLFVLLGISGCSNRAIYDNMRIKQRSECLKEPPSTYFECIERTNKSYEEYKREREEVLESGSHN